MFLLRQETNMNKPKEGKTTGGSHSTSVVKAVITNGAAIEGTGKIVNTEINKGTGKVETK